MESTLLSRELEKESTTAGHFPPNSKVTGVKCCAAADITILPTRVLPVNKIKTLKNNQVLTFFLGHQRIYN